jgi:intracellular multiplication protein IcmL
MAKKNQNALATVLLRNLFYRDAYKRVILCVFLVVILDVLLGASVVYKSMQSPPPQYFAATPDGRIIQQHPLSDPVFSDAHVLAYVSKATSVIYQRDYVHWQAQLQTISDYFSPPGWRNFIATLKANNNLNTLTQFKMVTKVTITGAAQILRKGVLGGHYSWVVKIPVLVQYLSPSHATISQSLDITYIIIRTPVQDNPDRIAINNFLPQTSGA